MAIHFPGANTINATLFSQKSDSQKSGPTLPESVKADMDSRMSISAQNNPTELILRSAMEKINEMFAPHLGEGAIQKAVDSGLDMSPEATAERIISFATQLISKVEARQVDLPAEERSSREQLFTNVQVGIERGFEQARDVLEGLQALNGEVKESTDATYGHVQEGLSDLAVLLGLLPSNQTQA